jgi:hypothetical protein
MLKFRLRGFVCYILNGLLRNSSVNVVFLVIPSSFSFTLVAFGRKYQEPNFRKLYYCIKATCIRQGKWSCG